MSEVTDMIRAGIKRSLVSPEVEERVSAQIAENVLRRIAEAEALAGAADKVEVALDQMKVEGWARPAIRALLEGGQA
jgi:hypothetical protein